MEKEVEISELLELIAIAKPCDPAELLKGALLYNPTLEKEYPIVRIESGNAEFREQNGRLRSLPISKISNWTCVLPQDSFLNNTKITSLTKSAQRSVVEKELRALSLFTDAILDIDDLKLILSAFKTSMHETTKSFRKNAYQTIKKMEMKPESVSASYRLGLKILEHWNTGISIQSPPDFLIQLAYYRRWNNQTDSALEATSIIEHPASEHNFNTRELAVLATERAAAFMDKFEQTGNGIARAHRFLKYHHKLNRGRSDEHNQNTWKRYEVLVAKKP